MCTHGLQLHLKALPIMRDAATARGKEHTGCAGRNKQPCRTQAKATETTGECALAARKGDAPCRSTYNARMQASRKAVTILTMCNLGFGQRLKGRRISAITSRHVRDPREHHRLLDPKHASTAPHATVSHTIHSSRSC
jgi:hypothetical protein